MTAFAGMDRFIRAKAAGARRLAAFVALSAAGAAMAAPADLPRAAEEFFPLDCVRLTGGPLKAQQEQNRRYLLKLEPDRLLSRFRSEAGLKPKAKPYGGWEYQPQKNGLDLPGHILGFYMSGAAMTLEATGDPELRKRLLYIVDELEAVQNAHGDGYALASKNARNVFKQIVSGDIRLHLYGERDSCGFINGCFGPVYTMNKILLGLWRIHIATGSEKAKKVMLRLSDWFGENVVDKMPDDLLQKMLKCEHGSLPETFVYAYQMTGDEKYRRWAARLCHEEIIGPLAKGDKDNLLLRHANMTIPKFTGAERVFRITGEERLHRSTVNAWNAIVQDHTWAIGGNAHNEHFFPKDKFEEKMWKGARRNGVETCNSVNMLRLTEALFEMAPSGDKVEYYERVLFNHLLSSHEPIMGRTAYITPMWPGASRSYSDEFKSMWCCTGTGFEAPGKYAQMVFTKSAAGDAVRLNLFAPCELDWKERGVKLRQETAFPYGETACVKIENAGTSPEFTLKIRRPAWTDGRFAVYVNGRRAETAKCEAGYVAVKREWKSGDRVDIEFPMFLRAEPLPAFPQYAAFFYGPELLVADMGTAGKDPQDYIAKPAGDTRTTWKFSPVQQPQEVPAGVYKNPECCLERTTGGAIAFRMKGTDLLLKPVADTHFTRYSTYWRVSDAKR